MTFDVPTADRFRRAFRAANPAMVFLWRLGLGPWLGFWPRVTGRILVLVHTGRRSGNRYLTPLNYAIVDGDVYCLAGFGSRTDWFRNTLKDPRVEVWMPDGWWDGVVEDVSDHPARADLLRAVLIGSGFAAPLFGVDPQMSPERLTAELAEYRLVRINRTAARTGPGGPGDLAWIWPLLAVAMAARRRRR